MVSEGSVRGHWPVPRRKVKGEEPGEAKRLHHSSLEAESMQRGNQQGKYTSRSLSVTQPF